MSRLCIFILAVSLLALCAPAGGAVRADTVVGTLVEIHGHRVDGSQTAQRFAIRDAGRERLLADDQADSLIGQRVRLTDSRPAAGVQGEARAVGEQRLAPAPAVGPQTLLVILVTTADAPNAAATPDAAHSAVFTDPASANAMHQQQSAGAARFVGRIRGDGDVTAPLRISATLRGCDHFAIASAADRAATAAGWVPDAYDHVLYVSPNTAECAWGGLGELPGRRTWSNGYLDTRVIAHELGHNLGANHANAYRCADAGGAAVTLSATCFSSEYADPFDVMGLAPFLMSSWHRAQIGQLPAGQELSVRESQTVALVSSDDFSRAGPRLLLVPRKEPHVPVTSWLAVELRSALAPFDLWSPGAPVTTGLSIRLVPDKAVFTQSQLLDARPATFDESDAPLQAGETMRDDAHGIAIRADAVEGATASVSVTMPTLIDDVAPTPPRSVTATGDTNAVALRWPAASDDDGVDHYEVERDGAIIGTTTGLSFDDERVAELTTTAYRVIAVDRSGNRGASDPTQITLSDLTPPSTVPGVSASAAGATVTVSWAAAQDNRAIRSYRVVRDGRILTETGAMSYTDQPGDGIHRYELSATDSSGNRGPGTSAQVTVSVPAGAPGGSAGSGVPDANTGFGITAGANTGSAIGGDDANAGLGIAAAGTRPTAALPRIVLRGSSTRSTRGGRLVVMRFSASGATSMRAYRAGRRIASAAGSRLTVRMAMPRRRTRRTVRIVASSRAGAVSRSWALRSARKLTAVALR